MWAGADEEDGAGQGDVHNNVMEVSVPDELDPDENQEEAEERGCAGKWREPFLPRDCNLTIGRSSFGYLDQFERNQTPVLPPRPHVSGRKGAVTPSSGATSADVISPSISGEATPDMIRSNIPTALARVLPGGGSSATKGHRSSPSNARRAKAFQGIKFVMTGLDPTFILDR